MEKEVVISSFNPVKIESTKEAFSLVFKNEKFIYNSVSASSEVSDQPFGSQETYIGALNRVKNSKKIKKGANFYIGIESGIEEIEDDLAAFSWILIESNNGLAKAKTATFFLPKSLSKLIKEGKEMGEASDIVFKSINIKQKGGAIGYLTRQVIDRTKLYTHAIVLALIKFNNKDLYK